MREEGDVPDPQEAGAAVIGGAEGDLRPTL